MGQRTLEAPYGTCEGCGDVLGIHDDGNVKCHVCRAKRQPKIVNRCEYTITSTVIDETIAPQGETDELGRAFEVFAKQVSESRFGTLVRVRGKYGDTIIGMQGARRD